MLTNVKKIFLGFLLMVLSLAPNLSYADWSIGIGVGDGWGNHDRGYWHDRDDHRYWGWHDHPHWGWHIHFLPAGYYTIWVGGERYYYYDGLYYSYVGNGDYILVQPPMGAYVSSIPPDFQPVIVNGVTYYSNNGVYYIWTHHHGYKVVAAPVMYAPPEQVVYTQTVQTVAPAPTTVVQAPTVVVDTQDTFPLNIPNSSGGYTSVVIKKSGNGYVGPQGEFYTTFPSVSQLKAMYGK